MDPPPQQLQQQQQALVNYHFSPEEVRVLRECNTESFFQRSLPIGSALGVLTYLGVKNGYLQPNIKYGATPKVVLAVVFGYFIGKFSYQQKCAEKLMRLPNSKIGELLLKRKKNGLIGANQDLGVGLALTPFGPNVSNSNEDQTPMFSRSGSALDLDSDSRPSISGLDDIYRPSLDNTSSYLEPEIPIEPVKQGTSYEELRKKNREEYNKKMQNPYARPLPPEAPVVLREREIVKPTASGDKDLTMPLGHKNKYGDTWTD